jgi:putative ABC transport system substrate-binding protein
MQKGMAEDRMIFRRVAFLAALTLVILMAPYAADAQRPAAVYRVGVIHPGGPFQRVVEGTQDGLKELGLEEGKQFVLDIRDTKGDLKAVEQAAKSLERGKVNLIYAMTTSVALAVKRATSQTPIVFYAGTDPVAAGLVASLAKPGGRLTGVHTLVTDLTGKRLEILKEILPKLRRAVTLYNPRNQIAQDAAKLGREAARQLGVQLIERHVTSVEELRLGLQALKPGEVDAYFFTSDLMVASQAQLIIDTAKTKKLPTMFQEESFVVKGALASYGLSFREAGRMSARYVQRILAGTNPRDLPVENFHKIQFVLNLRTARELGVSIPPAIVVRADKVIQ